MPKTLLTKFSFRPRTCVEPKLEFNAENELVINYMEKTVVLSEKSDQGPACINTVETVYMITVLFAILTGIGIVRFYDQCSKW